MRKINFDELKELQLSILDEVAEFCDKENINYFLTAGTLIGAIRHKGYIPWDDDIDICMLREDYEKFIRIFPRNHDNLYIYKHDEKEHPECPFFFTKVCKRGTVINEFFLDNDKIKGCGVNIDIFPIDRSPSYEKAKRAINKIMMIKRLVGIKSSQKDFSSLKGIGKYLISLLLMPISVNFFNRMLNNVLAKECSKDGQFAACMVWGYGEREIISSDTFNSSIDVDFEGRKFKAMKKYEVYLTAVYGDYMKLPPEEQRVTHHSFEGYYE